MDLKHTEKLAAKFNDIFGYKHDKTYFSPGRVNLIGEHIDYSGGHVFPCAITKGTMALVGLRDDKEVHAYSENFADLGTKVFNIDDDLTYDDDDEWVNFVKGVVHFIKKAGHEVTQGFDLLIYGDIPNGAGLSSSASLELLIGVIVDDLDQLNISRLDLVKIGQQVENHFIGVNSGIMDQFAVGFGETDTALYLDVNTLDYEKVPVDFKDNVILIMNTNKRRELADSKYNQRRQESDAALARLQEKLDIQTLGDLTNETFEANSDLLTDPILYKRAKHAVSENNRTKAAKEVLAAGDLEKFGQLLNESHISLRDDYEVTGVELDTLVQEAWECDGVLGARMTGAGMGGCAIALVNKDNVDHVIDVINKAYKEKIGYAASFYVAEIGPGAEKVSD